MSEMLTAGKDGFFCKINAGSPALGQGTPLSGSSNVVIGITSIEVGTSSTSVSPITVSPTDASYISTHSESSVEVQGQLIDIAELSQTAGSANLSLYVSGAVVSAIITGLTTAGFNASKGNTYFYIKVSGATTDQAVINGASQTIFMLNSDDFVTFKIKYGEFLELYSGAQDFACIYMNDAGSFSIDSFKTGFIEDSNPTKKATVSYNYSAK